MFQRLKNKKGFTLIELIVVIAILGILALIAIPRFSGFTDRAKRQADDQYAALIANSTMVMVAAGQVGYAPTIPTGETVATARLTVSTAGTIAAETSTAGLTFSASGNNYLTFANYIIELEKMVKLGEPLKFYTGNGMLIAFTDAGVKTVVQAP